MACDPYPDNPYYSRAEDLERRRFLTRAKRSHGLLPYTFQELMDKYEGEYVAIVGKRIIAHGRDGKKVFDKAQKANPRSTIFLVQVPTEEAMILWIALVSDSQGKDQRLLVI